MPAIIDSVTTYIFIHCSDKVFLIVYKLTTVFYGYATINDIYFTSYHGSSIRYSNVTFYNDILIISRHIPFRPTCSRVPTAASRKSVKISNIIVIVIVIARVIVRVITT